MMYDDTQIPINLFINFIKGKIKILYHQQYTGRWNFTLKKKLFDENFNKTMLNKKKIVVSTSTIDNDIIVYYIICE